MSPRFVGESIAVECSPLDRESCLLSVRVSESFCTAVPVESATNRATYTAFSAEL